MFYPGSPTDMVRSALLLRVSVPRLGDRAATLSRESGTVTQVEGVVHGGWLATIDLERRLRDLDGGSKAPRQIEVAWEEPVPAFPARFEKGQRILLAIEPLSTASIWKQRVPDSSRRSRLYSVTDKANAYLERPSASELRDLEHYLALGADARRGHAGMVYLAALASRAQPRLAISALGMLAASPKLAKELDAGTANHLCNAVLRAGREPGEVRGTAEDDVSEVALALFEQRRPKALRPVLKARIAQLEPSAPAVLYAALGAIDGSIPDAIALELLASASVEHRLHLVLGLGQLDAARAQGRSTETHRELRGQVGVDRQRTATGSPVVHATATLSPPPPSLFSTSM